MSHAIIRSKSGRRHEVDFEGCALRVEVHASDETVEIFVEADTAELPEDRRRFALIRSCHPATGPPPCQAWGRSEGGHEAPPRPSKRPTPRQTEPRIVVGADRERPL